jgi:hypothetical protein
VSKMIALFLLLVFAACLMGYVRGTFGKSPRAGSRPADDPAGGFATPKQIRERLSEHAVRAAGAQVRPGLPTSQVIGKRERKGLFRGRH